MKPMKMLLNVLGRNYKYSMTFQIWNASIKKEREQALNKF